MTLAPEFRVRTALATLGKSVRVGAYDYAIEVWENREGAIHGLFGECSPKDQRISISAEMAAPAPLVDTVIHEITHAIFWVYGVYEADGEERTVNALSSAWTQVYRDNPWLLSWIAETLA